MTLSVPRARPSASIKSKLTIYLILKRPKGRVRHTKFVDRRSKTHIVEPRYLGTLRCSSIEFKMSPMGNCWQGDFLFVAMKAATLSYSYGMCLNLTSGLRLHKKRERHPELEPLARRPQPWTASVLRQRHEMPQCCKFLSCDGVRSHRHPRFKKYDIKAKPTILRSWSPRSARPSPRPVCSANAACSSTMV